MASKPNPPAPVTPKAKVTTVTIPEETMRGLKAVLAKKWGRLLHGIIGYEVQRAIEERTRVINEELNTAEEKANA